MQMSYALVCGKISQEIIISHLFIGCIHTHTQPFPANAKGLLTQINNPNEAFHQKPAYERRSQ